MNLKYLIGKGVYKYYGQKEAGKVIDEAVVGMTNKDWVSFYNQMYDDMPSEDEVLAPNSDHVKLYDKDIQELKKIKTELEEVVEKEIPEYEFVRFFDEGIVFHSHITPIVAMASANGKVEPTLSEKLVEADGMLCEMDTGVDVAECLSFAHSTIAECIEESSIKVRIVQKGKTGEDYFSRILDKYKHKYTALENIVIPAAEGDGITSETDAYIITDKGLFVCEVKNYGKEGETLVVLEDDKWYMMGNADGRLLGTKMSATKQNERHCRATKAFLEKHLGNINIPIIPVVVIANDGVGIENRSKSPIIYARDIESFIEQYDSCISTETKDKIRDAFLEHKLDMVDYPVKLNKSRAEHAKKIHEEVIPYAKANIKIANGIHELRGKCNLYTNLVIFALAALLGLITGDLSIAVVTIISFLIASFSKNTIGFIGGIAATVGFVVGIVLDEVNYCSFAIVALIVAVYFGVFKANKE